MATSPAQEVPKKCLCCQSHLPVVVNPTTSAFLSISKSSMFFDVLQSLGTLFKLLLDKRNGATVLLTNVHNPAAIQTPTVSNVQRPHIPDLQQNIDIKRKLNTLYLEKDSTLICFSNGFYAVRFSDRAVPSVTSKVIHVNHYVLTLPDHNYVR